MDAPTDAAVVEEVTAEGPRRPWLTLSPLNRRRWETFKAHRRGYWSLWIFLFLFVISLFAEFIANDRPLLVKYDGHYYMPVFKSYPETAFGGMFETEAVYRDPAVKEMIAKSGGWILWPPIRFSYDTPNKTPPMAFPVKPTWMLTEEDCERAVEQGFHPCNDDLEWNWLGTDDAGRDVVARVHLRLSHLGAVRPRADALRLRHRRRGGSGTGLFRRLDRSPVSALHRGVDERAAALSA